MLGNVREKLKPSYDEHRQVLGKILPLNTPLKLIIDASEACNFRCAYCFRSDKNKENWGFARDCRNMEWEVFEKVVEQIKDFPDVIRQISLSCHGEPLCNRLLPDMVRYLKSEGIKGKVSIHTNASLLDEEYAKRLAESGIDRIVVSLQGLTAEKYREICGADIDFDVFYTNLKRLYECKKETEISVKIVDAALEKNEQEKFYELFGAVADRVFIEKIVPIWKNIGNASESIMTENKYGGRVAEQKCCSLMFRTLVVAPNGDIYPCTQLLGNEVLGNVWENSLYECWNGEKRRKLMEDILLLRPAAMCNGCNIRQNSVFQPEDMIDGYREEILMRLNNRQRVK